MLERQHALKTFKFNTQDMDFSHFKKFQKTPIKNSDIFRNAAGSAIWVLCFYLKCIIVTHSSAINYTANVQNVCKTDVLWGL